MPQVSSKEQFDRQAAHYDKQWNSWSEETLDWLIGASEAKPTDTALDIATGAGFTACALATLAGHVTATDVSTGMLGEARQRASSSGLSNIDFIEAPAEKQPFAHTSFDIVACRIAAHHFLDIDAFLGETARLLKPGGRFLLVDTTVPDDNLHIGEWQNETEKLRDPSHVRNRSAAEWRKDVEAAGLTVTECVIEGKGITIGLTDWLRKSGTPEPVAAEVWKRFQTAPGDIKAAYNIQQNGDDIVFTWLRILLKAVKS